MNKNKRHEVALVDLNTSRVRRPEGFEADMEKLIHPPVGFGEAHCGSRIEVMTRVYSSRTGWVIEPHEYNCTRPCHKAGPHIAHDIEGNPLMKWYEERDDRNGLEVVR